MSRQLAERTNQRWTRATALAGRLSRTLDLAATPTVDGRVIVYAPRARGDQVLQEVIRLLRLTDATARLVDTGDARLALIEVANA